MRSETMASCLCANHVPIAANFENARHEGCISEYSALFEDALRAVERYTTYGVGHGFGREYKKLLTVLTEQIMQICEQTDMGQYMQISEEINQSKKELQKMANKKNKVDIRAEVLMYVEAYEKGARTMLGVRMAEKRKPILEESVVRFGDLRRTLDEVVDISSPVALEHATVLVAQLKKWAAETTISMHTAETNLYLDKALQAAEQWAAEQVVVGGGPFKRPKVADDISAVVFQIDDMTRIGESDVYLNKMHNFKDNLSDYRDAVENGRYNYSDEERSVKEVRAQVERKEAEKQELVAACKRGEIDRHTLYVEAKELDADIADYSNEAVELEKSISMKKIMLRTYERVFRKLDRLCKMIVSYENEPVMMTYLAKMIDFERINRVMRGVGSDEDVDHLLDIRMVQQDITDNAREQMERIGAELRRINDEPVRAQAIETVEKAKVSKEEEEYLARLLGEDTAEEAPAATERTENRYILSDEEK